MPPGYWFITQFSEYAKPKTYVTILTTDEPCHLWLRWSLNAPQRHPKARFLRGLAVMGDVYYCFTAYHDIEQAEAGDTIVHTFTVPNWSACQTRWFYFHGQANGVNVPSTSPIFGRHLYSTPGSFTSTIISPSDEAQYSSPVLLVCPTLCPLGLAVGRSTAPGIKLGAGIRFQNFQVPRYAEVIQAFMRFTCNWTKWVTWVNCQISVEADSNPPNWFNATVPQFLNRWNTRQGTVNWDNIPGWTKDVIYQSPDISPTINALVYRSDWISGNPASFFWDDLLQRTGWGALAIRRCYSRTQSAVTCPSIHVYFNHWQIEEIT